VHDFLSSRRARITPEQAGMPTDGEKRRVPGLRREEVASLAGVSFDYYARLERGNLSGVSDSVLEALARALQLDEAERQHLFDLAKAASVPVSRSRPAKPPVTRVRPAVLSILNGMTGTPAYVRNAGLDIMAANDLCLALYDGVLVRTSCRSTWPGSCSSTPTRRPFLGLGHDCPRHGRRASHPGRPRPVRPRPE
jgi:transcriptional regulator with XRE-family HTH domain